MVPPNGDAGAEGISFLWTNIADDPRVGDVVPAIDRNIGEANGREVLVPSTRFRWGAVECVPIPWHKQPSSLA